MAENSDQGLPNGQATDNSLQIAVLGHLLKNEREQTASTLDTMASLLQAAVPDRVEVSLSGWRWSKVRTVTSMSIRFDEAHYQIVRNKSGSPTVTKQKIVRGINLKSTAVSMEDFITEVVATLSELEKKSAATRIALTNFVNGR